MKITIKIAPNLMNDLNPLIIILFWITNNNNEKKIIALGLKLQAIARKKRAIFKCLFFSATKYAKSESVVNQENKCPLTKKIEKDRTKR